MVFSSGVFLFVFLPITIFGNWILRNRSIIWKNLFLLAMSFGFYIVCGIFQFILLLMSIIFNYLFAQIIARKYSDANNKIKRVVLFVAVAYNIGLLFVFKYLSFVVGQASIVFHTSLSEKIAAIALPLGISFYTFQALSYVIDVYRNGKAAEKNLVNVALYISFFPQLVAGPIVRWDSIRADLTNPNRHGDLDEGIQRFTYGLAKKVIISNQMAIFADKAFNLLEIGELTTGFAWLGAITYTLQIYFDFSGYSDMAIGLGRMFGFYFPENFDYPYISKSITEFWRRWHISLSTWFRDYVYIPLGGNRCRQGRMYFNLFIVWILTGIWHGANYTFWLWGLLYFILLVFEKAVIYRNEILVNKLAENKLFSVLGHLYTLFFVMLLWVLFRADSVSQAIAYIEHMFGKTANTIYAVGATKYYYKNAIGIGLLALIGCTPWLSTVKRWATQRIGEKAVSIISEIWIVTVFILACCATVDSNYNPFIYFNF